MLTIIETPIFQRMVADIWGEVVLVAAYAKAKFDNMPVEILKAWKEAYDA